MGKSEAHQNPASMNENLDNEGVRNPAPEAARSAAIKKDSAGGFLARGEQEKKERSVLWQVLGLAWDLGYIIAIPLVLLALGGRLLDRHFNTSPLFLLVGIFVSLIVTTVGVYRKTRDIMKDLK